MTGHHLHLILNHFPVVSVVLSILFFAWGLLRSDKSFVRAGLVIAVLAGLFAAPTFLSGEAAEEALEHSPRFVESLVEEHEDAAKFAIWAIEILAVTAASALYFSIKKNMIPKILLVVVSVLQVFTMAVVARTNNLGGRISHPEIRNGAPLPGPAVDKE